MINSAPNGPLLAIAWGTLTDAFYNVYDRHKDNPYVKASLKIGVQGARDSSSSSGARPCVSSLVIMQVVVGHQ